MCGAPVYAPFHAGWSVMDSEIMAFDGVLVGASKKPCRMEKVCAAAHLGNSKPKAAIKNRREEEFFNVNKRSWIFQLLAEYAHFWNVSRVFPFWSATLMAGCRTMASSSGGNGQPGRRHNAPAIRGNAEMKKSGIMHITNQPCRDSALRCPRRVAAQRMW
jgi:hypothetical protein